MWYQYNDLFKKIDKLGFVKIRYIHSLQDAVKIMKRQGRLEAITTHTFNKDRVSRIHKEVQVKSKEANSLIF